MPNKSLVVMFVLLAFVLSAGMLNAQPTTTEHPACVYSSQVYCDNPAPTGTGVAVYQACTMIISVVFPTTTTSITKTLTLEKYSFYEYGGVRTDNWFGAQTRTVTFGSSEISFPMPSNSMGKKEVRFEMLPRGTYRLTDGTYTALVVVGKPIGLPSFVGSSSLSGTRLESGKLTITVDTPHPTAVLVHQDAGTKVEKILNYTLSSVSPISWITVSTLGVGPEVQITVTDLVTGVSTTTKVATVSPFVGGGLR